MPSSFSCQVLIAGGGIAGLWSLRRLLAAGYNAFLLEQNHIGSGQTLGSQGILHGGVKYGLDGSNRAIADQLRSQPPRWLDSLAGRGELNLSSATITSPCQHLWAADSWLARVGATVGARAMQGEVSKLNPADWPAALRDGGHHGSVYQLEESVLDVRSVCHALADPVKDRILHGSIDNLSIKDGRVTAIQCGDLSLSADVFLFTAATGNELASAALGFGPKATQRRPLRMIMARGPLPPLWGHCVAVSPKPVATITSHDSDSSRIWYLGGAVAEDGASLSNTDAIANAARTAARILPNIPWHAVQWASWLVDRAEPAADSRLPDGPVLRPATNAAVCWPSKLVYAPALADLTEAFVRSLTSPSGLSSPPPPLPLATMGSYPWESASWLSL